MINPLDELSDIYLGQISEADNSPEAIKARVMQHVRAIRYRARKEGDQLNKAYNDYMAGQAGISATEKSMVKERLGLTGGAQHQEGMAYGLSRGTGKPSGPMAAFGKKKTKKTKPTVTIDKPDKLVSLRVSKEGYYSWRHELSEYSGMMPKKNGDAEEKITEKKVKNKVIVNPAQGQAESFAKELGGQLLEACEVFQILEVDDDQIQLLEVKDRKGKGSGTKDACYHKVKSRYSVWPSAYASGALVKCRRVGAANWGNSTKKEDVQWKDIKYKAKSGESTFLSDSDGNIAFEIVDVIAPAVQEAKVDKGRSDYGKASIRNYRRMGPGHSEPGMFDPEGKRGKTIDKRREEHKARRGVKGAKVPAYKVEEYQRDPEKLKKDKTHSKQPDPSKDGFTGIGNMSIKDIMKMNAKMKKEETEVVDEAKVDDSMIFGKSAARNERRFGKKGQFDPSGSGPRGQGTSERAQLAVKRGEEHKARRGVKTKGMSEDYETKKKEEIMGALKKRDLKQKVKEKIAADIIKRKGDVSKSDDRYAYESVEVVDEAKYGPSEVRYLDKEAEKRAQQRDAARTENRIAAKERAAQKRRSERNQLRRQGQYGAQGKYYVTKQMEKEEKEGFSNWRDTLDEKCWAGYEKKGMKTMFGKRYPNCVKKKTKKEEVEFQEKLDLKKADMGDVVKDFYKSDAPQFKGRSKEKRREMAIAAKLTAERGKLPEDYSANPAQQAAIAIAKKERKQDLKVAQKKKMKEEIVTELNRFEKEKGVDTKTGKPVTKGGTAKNDKAFQFVMKKVGKQRMGANQPKKVRGAKNPNETSPTKQKMTRMKAAKASSRAFETRAKKAGYKTAQDYANVVARYGSEDNMKKGRGLGT